MHEIIWLISSPKSSDPYFPQNVATKGILLFIFRLYKMYLKIRIRYLIITFYAAWTLRHRDLTYTIK